MCNIVKFTFAEAIGTRQTQHWHLQVQQTYQHAVKEAVVDLGFADPVKAAQLSAHRVENVKVRHPTPAQGCVVLGKLGQESGKEITSMQVSTAILCLEN